MSRPRAAFRDFPLSDYTRPCGLKNPNRIKRFDFTPKPWQPYAVNSKATAKIGVLCRFCRAFPDFSPAVRMKGWWYRKLRAVGMSYAEAEHCCPACWREGKPGPKPQTMKAKRRGQ
jgi:hypothetical protein